MGQLKLLMPLLQDAKHLVEAAKWICFCFDLANQFCDDVDICEGTFMTKCAHSSFSAFDAHH